MLDRTESGGVVDDLRLGVLGRVLRVVVVRGELRLGSLQLFQPLVDNLHLTEIVLLEKVDSLVHLLDFFHGPLQGLDNRLEGVRNLNSHKFPQLVKQAISLL